MDHVLCGVRRIVTSLKLRHFTCDGSMYME